MKKLILGMVFVFATVTSVSANSLDEKVSPIIIDSAEVVVGEGASECNALAREGAIALAEDQDDRSASGELMMIYKSMYFHCMAN